MNAIIKNIYIYHFQERSRILLQSINLGTKCVWCRRETDARTILLWERDIQLLNPKCVTFSSLFVYDIPISRQGKRTTTEFDGESVSTLLKSDKSRQSETSCAHTVVVHSVEYRMDDYSTGYSEHSDGGKKYYISVDGK